MITLQTAEQSLALAAIAANRGLEITSVEGTPINELCKIHFNVYNSGASAINNDLNIEDHLKSEASYIQASTEGTEQSLHNSLMDNFIKDISLAVGTHISYAKNVVKPTIMTIYEKVKIQLDNMPPAGHEYQVEIHDIPEPLKNDGFESSFKQFEGKIYLPPESCLYLKEMNGPEILELMKSGSSIFDQAVESWYAKMGEAWFVTLWDNLFRDVSVSKPQVIMSFDQALVKDEDAEDYCLAVFLLARKLQDDVPEGTTMQLAVYNRIVNQYKEAAACRLLNFYTVYNSTLKTKTLVKSFSQDRKIVHVHGPVYTQWINEGNSNETLLGLLISNQNIYMSDLITSNAHQYAKDWESFLNFAKVAHKNRAFTFFKDAFSFAYQYELSNICEQEQSYFEQNSQHTQQVKSRFVEALNKVPVSALDDIYECITKVVCKARYYYTDAERFLTRINELCEHNTNLDVREAALLASTEYVSDYIADQLKLI